MWCAVLLLPTVAFAQDWKVYTFGNPAFIIQFPSTPALESGRVKNSTGTLLPLTRYVARQDGVTYTLSVVDHSNTNADALTTIRETEKRISATGKVTQAGGARITRHFGRNLSLDNPDGSRSVVAIFFVDKHLFTMDVRTPAPATEATSFESLRFLESLRFSDDDSVISRFFGGSAPVRLTGAPPAAPVAATVATPAAAATVVAPPAPVGAVAAAPAATPAAAPAPVPGPVPSAHADAACAGKSPGDIVQLATATGSVAAVCTLVAQPLH